MPSGAMTGLVRTISAGPPQTGGGIHLGWTSNTSHVMAEEEEPEAALIAELYRPPALLPIAQLKDPLLYAIETFPVTIIVSQ